MRLWILLIMSITTLGEEVWAQSGAGALTWRPIIVGRNGIVAAEHPLQAEAGMRVLRAGGNAIDAAIAVFYMTAVTEPSEAGLGGDGFILAYIKALDRVILINGSGGAPKLATRDYYQGHVGTVPPDGPFSTAVPGSVGGFDVLLKKYGTKKYPELVRDAIDAAAKGYGVTPWGAGNYRRSRDLLARFPSSASIFLPNGKAPVVGDWLVQRDLARTIEAIAQQGASAFYKGDIAKLIANYHERAGGRSDRAGRTGGKN